VIEWLLNEPEDPDHVPESWLFIESWEMITRGIAAGTRSGSEAADRDAQTKSIAEGLVGLVALGQAWESVDVFLLLHHASRRLDHSSLALLAQARAHELAEAGRLPLHPDLRQYADEY